jgi:hypothetical protein
VTPGQVVPVGGPVQRYRCAFCKGRAGISVPDSNRAPFHHNGAFQVDFGETQYRGRKQQFHDMWDVDGVRRALPAATGTTPHPINWRRLIIGGLVIAAVVAVVAIILI